MTDCEFCEVREYIAKVFDLHWLDEVDCPFVCPKIKQESKDENNDNN